MGKQHFLGTPRVDVELERFHIESGSLSRHPVRLGWPGLRHFSDLLLDWNRSNNVRSCRRNHFHGAHFDRQILTTSRALQLSLFHLCRLKSELPVLPVCFHRVDHDESGVAFGSCSGCDMFQLSWHSVRKRGVVHGRSGQWVA